MAPKYEYTQLPAWPSRRTRGPHDNQSRCILAAFYVICLAITSLGGFLVGAYSDAGKPLRCIRKGSEWSVALAELEKHPVRFSGSFNFTNRYRAPPSAELDREWDRFTDHPLIDGTASLIAVNANDIARANKSGGDEFFNSTVEYGQANGGGYMATLEIFHQLHCLNMLRKAVHSDYYREMKPLPNGLRSDTMATHLDHCIEILRQVISCYGDTGLITFHWVNGNPVPYPDFNTWHQCRDPEKILAWAKQREAPIKAMVEKGLFEDIVEMSTAP